ncbi:hypothetical protein GVN20_29160 [Runella sp. CRIBMP]|nr:hypothetical protein [Runella sp. CRIBMP]
MALYYGWEADTDFLNYKIVRDYARKKKEPGDSRMASRLALVRLCAFCRYGALWIGRG